MRWDGLRRTLASSFALCFSLVAAAVSCGDDVYPAYGIGGGPPGPAEDVGGGADGSETEYDTGGGAEAPADVLDGVERPEPAEANGTNVFTETVEPVAGQIYPAGAVIHVASIGVGLVIPDGWRGALVDELFVVELLSEDAAIFVFAVEGAAEQARSEMEASIDLGDGVVLVPTGSVRIDGPVLSASYSVNGGELFTDGYVKVVVGEYGWSVAMVAISTSAVKATMISGTDGIAASVAFKDPEINEGAPADGGGEWREGLSNQLLHRFYTGSGYSEHERMWLCADGRAARSFESGGSDLTAGFSLAFGSDYAGTWSVTGDETNPMLELVYADGTYSSWSLSVADDKLYLDDGRWYMEGTVCD